MFASGSIDIGYRRLSAEELMERRSRWSLLDRIFGIGVYFDVRISMQLGKVLVMVT